MTPVNRSYIKQGGSASSIPCRLGSAGKNAQKKVVHFHEQGTGFVPETSLCVLPVFILMVHSCASKNNVEKLCKAVCRVSCGTGLSMGGIRMKYLVRSVGSRFALCQTTSCVKEAEGI